MQRGVLEGCARGAGATVAELYPDSSDPELEDEEKCHPGELEPDFSGDGWADWDEDCHGPIDSNSNRKDYPENFKWSCCGAVGTYAEGCEEAE